MIGPIASNPVRRASCAVAVVLCWLLAAIGVAHAEGVPVPELHARVTDEAYLLDADQRDNIEKRLAWFEQRKGTQIAVLTVPTTQPETIEQFATRVFARWRLGRAGVNDGILLLVARDDRTLRIEVGRGLEGAVPDVVARHIIDDYITPQFREKHYYDGLDAAADCLIHLIDNEPLPAPRAPVQAFVPVAPTVSVDRDSLMGRVANGSGNPADLDSYLGVYIAMLMFSMVLQFYLVRLARWQRPLLGALITVAAVGWYWFDLPGNVLAWSLLGALLLHLFLEYAGLVLGSSSGGYSGSGSSDSGWSSDSSWSGGGGDSAGGGASGSW